LTKSWVIDMIAAGDLEGYRCQAHATLSFDVRDRLGEIAVPTTVIHGERDATIPCAIAPVTAGAIAGAQLRILEGQGHFAHLEAPDRFNAVLAEALRIPTDLVPAR
jgi:pimeloyl-ACP methyl ester carboxylesterase